MADVFDTAKRSEIMSRIRGRDTKPELLVRRIAHGLGFRFRLHRRDLPGCPDIVFPKYRAVIQVHGCFWHRHPNCRFASSPKTRAEYWMKKFEGNVLRDEYGAHRSGLEDDGDLGMRNERHQGRGSTH